MNLGELIKKKRLERGISARELSLGIGKSASYVSKVENGTIDPTLQSFALIAGGLEMNQWEIWACVGVAKGDE